MGIQYTSMNVKILRICCCAQSLCIPVLIKRELFDTAVFLSVFKGLCSHYCSGYKTLRHSANEGLFVKSSIQQRQYSGAKTISNLDIPPRTLWHYQKKCLLFFP